MDKISLGKGKLGFGTLRLPQKNGIVDITELSEMVDIYMQNGFNYFDLAHAYMSGCCENAMMLALTSRYKRSEYVLANKLTWEFFKTQKDINDFFKKQLMLCGVEYFDIYLMHAITRYKYKKFKECNAFKVLSGLKKRGKIKHIGISFHDKPAFLEELLIENPEIEIVQIQFNYADYESSVIESKHLYEVCRKYKKTVIAMESVKGGSLANLPNDVAIIFDELNKEQNTSFSYYSFALRYVAEFDDIKVILSGMSNTKQVIENVNVIKNVIRLNDDEKKAIRKVTKTFNSKKIIQCTACKYCIDGCPKKILIPDMFACYNQKRVFNNWNQQYYYDNVVTANKPKASECIRCGLCEKACPQNLKIPELLKNVANEFEFEINSKWINGELRFFNQGVIDNNYTGIGTTALGNKVFFKNGVFQKYYSGTVLDAEGNELLFESGIFHRKTGAFWIDNTLSYFDNGIKDSEYTGIAKTSKGNLVMMTNGIFNKHFTGLISDQSDRIIYVKEGVHDSKFSGKYKNRKIENGIMV